MKSPSKPTERAKALLREARHIAVLTGAGISAESGIKTFRDAGGLWEDHQIDDVATPQGFRRDPDLVWRFYNARRKAADQATPNAAHIALARLELGLRRQVKGVSKVGGLTILTQNIDGLHQQAGSQNVLELHGSIWLVRCTDCGRVSDDFPIELVIPPSCPECNALLRPHVVWFGEALDPDIIAAAEEAVKQCDVFLVIGTSAVVQPAATFPLLALRLGVPLIEINTEMTPLSVLATVALRGPAGQLLPEIIAH